MKTNRKRIGSAILIVAVSAAVLWDFSRAGRMTVVEGVFCPESRFVNAVTSASSKVSIVPSDYETLPQPVARTSAVITYPQIEDMVREALRLQGGIDWLIKKGDKVLIKPNICDPELPGSGEITDVRVVKALLRIIHQATEGQVELIIGEGSPREMDYELPYSPRTTPRWTRLWDKAGYQDLLSDPDLQGVNFRLQNLNGSPPENPWQDLVLIDVPGGGVAAPQKGQYWMHRDVLEADVFITVPVLKTHKAGLTCALKNQVGIAPSTKYGFSKTGGVPQDQYAHRLVHRDDLPRDWVDEELIDLSTIAEIDLVVVDALVTLQQGKEAIRDANGNITNQVRFNTILAGIDPVAVDNVCARMIGLNPDDINHLCLAEKVGLGTNNPEFIHVTGKSIEEMRQPLKKDPYFTSDYGQSNRTWLVSQPFSIQGVSDPMRYPFIENEAFSEPMAGQNGWSDAIYFFDDRIDLGSYNKGQNNIVTFAFSYFSAPKAQPAELWLGSDEAMQIYLNHQLVYQYNGTRSYRKEYLVLEKIPVQIVQGENTLLLKTLQKLGEHDFALNICEPESNPDLDGNRVAGLKFYTQSTAPAQVWFSLVDATGGSGASVLVPMSITKMLKTGLENCHFEIAYHPDHLESEGISSVGTLSEAWGHPKLTQLAPGNLSLELSDATTMNSIGTLVHLKFKIKDTVFDSTRIGFSSAQANDGKTWVATEDGQVVRSSEQSLAITFYPNSGYSLNPGSMDNLLAKLTMRNNVGRVDFKSLRVKMLGDGDKEDVAKISLFRDDGDGRFSATADVRLGYNRFWSETTVIRFRDIQMVEPQDAVFFLTVDISDKVSDPGRRFGVEISETNYFELYSPDRVFAPEIPFQTILVPLPVELYSFDANTEGQDVFLNWITVSETNNLRFEIEKSRDGEEWSLIGSQNGNGTTQTSQRYTFHDRVSQTGTYFYRLKQIDLSGQVEYLGELQVKVNAPAAYALLQNYPNPFNPETTIEFDLPTPQQVELTVFAVNGALVKTIVSRVLPAGHYTVTWDGRNESLLALPSGIYFAVLRAGDFRQTIRMNLLR